MHACIYIARARAYIRPILVRARARGGGRVYEIKTLRSNLAPEEGGGRLFEGGVYIIEQERYTS